MMPTRPFWMGEFPNTSWEVIQGDYLAYYIWMFCDCPSPVNINGYQFAFVVKESLDPLDPNKLCEVLWTAARGGECGVTALIVIPKLTAVLPDGRFAFDLKYRTPSGLVATLQRGELNVLPSSDLQLSEGLEVPPAAWVPPASSGRGVTPKYLAIPGNDYLKGFR